LPLEQSFVHCSADNVIITAFKQCEDDDSLILRFYEIHGKTGEVSFQFSLNILQVNETDLLERDLENSQIKIEDNAFTVHISPFEIKTIRIIREGFKWQKHHSFIPV
jgi:alpha-mannosidase